MELSSPPATVFMDDDFEAQTESAAADSSTSPANFQPADQRTDTTERHVHFCSFLQWTSNPFACKIL